MSLVEIMNAPNFEVLMKKLEESGLRNSSWRLLYREGIVRTGDLAIRSSEEILDIRGLSPKILGEINKYLDPLDVRFRKNEPKAARIWELYDRDVPLSCISLVAQVTSWVILALEEAGMIFLSDAKGVTAERLTRCFNRKQSGFRPESAAIQTCLKGIEDLRHLLS